MAGIAQKKFSTLLARAILCLFSFAATQQAHALDELLEIYNAPQALAMGNAWTADAVGHAALFHNPAGLAKAPLKGWEIVPVAVEGNFSTGFLGTAANGRSFGASRLMESLKTSPGSYNYFRTNVMPAVSRRGFGFALLGSYEYAAIADGTNIDVQTGTDVGFVFGGATNLAANMLKVGLAVKGILRNQLKGEYAYAAITNDSAANSALMKEGMGVGADFGMMITLPVSYLPTLGFTWKDIMGTRFSRSRILNAANMGVPDSIPQSFNVAMSVHPALGRGIRASFSAEFKHIERVDLPFRKRLHFGFQFITKKGFYLWAGANQLFPTMGIGYRVSGGDFELGSYAQDVGEGQTVTSDRRFVMRYTISF